MKDILLPPSFGSRIEIAKKIHKQCNLLYPNADFIPSEVTYHILLDRFETAEYIKSTYGTVKTWDSTKMHDLKPHKSGGKTVYRLLYLNQFLGRTLFAN